MTKLYSIMKSRDITLLTKVHLVKAMVFPVVIYGWESWTIKKAECRRIDAFELWCWRRPLRVPWTARRSNQSILKEISPVHGRTDVEAKTPILWPPDVKSWLIWKDPNAGKDWGQEEKGTTEDQMVGGHHWLNRHGFGWTPAVGVGQGGLVCCGSWGCKELDRSEWLNWTVHLLLEYCSFCLCCKLLSSFPIASGLFVYHLRRKKLSWAGACWWRVQFSSWILSLCVWLLLGHT